MEGGGKGGEVEGGREGVREGGGGREEEREGGRERGREEEGKLGEEVWLHTCVARPSPPHLSYVRTSPK